MRGPLRYWSPPKLPEVAVPPPSVSEPSGPTRLEIMLMTSMRNPSTPRSTQRRIMAWTASRTSGFSQLRSGCLRVKRWR